MQALSGWEISTFSDSIADQPHPSFAHSSLSGRTANASRRPGRSPCASSLPQKLLNHLENSACPPLPLLHHNRRSTRRLGDRNLDACPPRVRAHAVARLSLARPRNNAAVRKSANKAGRLQGLGERCVRRECSVHASCVVRCEVLLRHDWLQGCDGS